MTVQRFREAEGADSVYILTVLQPFTVSQSRCVVVVTGYEGQLISSNGCTPRTALSQGSVRHIDSQVLENFLRSLADAEMAWAGDVVPPNIHDGVTLTVERADANGYERVRIADFEVGGPHGRLIEAWTSAFPEARRIIG